MDILSFVEGSEIEAYALIITHLPAIDQHTGFRNNNPFQVRTYVKAPISRSWICLNSLRMATEAKEEFKKWLRDLDINYDTLDQDHRVSYKAQYDQAHPSVQQKSGTTAGNNSVTAFQRFIDLLPAQEKDALEKDTEANIVQTIEKYFSTRLLGLHTPAGAMQLLKEARLRPRETTLVRIEAKYRYALNGDFEGGERDASSGSIFIRAYETEARLTPRILKFTSTSDEAIFECAIYKRMNFDTFQDAIDTHVVPVLCEIKDIAGKFGFAMPSFISSLNKVNLPRRPYPGLEDAMLVCLNDILTALAHIHGREIYHNDIKPQNILLNSRGDSYLADFGSASCAHVERGNREIAFSDYYHPTDLFTFSTVTPSSANLDNLLLLITIVDVLGYLTRQAAFDNFTMMSLWEDIKKVKHVQLLPALRALWPT